MTAPRKQHGVVLFIALIVLVAMSLAGVALWRSIGTGIMIAGNVAMQRGAVTSSDAGIEAGRQWLIDNSGVLNNTQQGYVSFWDERFDAAVFDWANSSTTVGTDAAGFTTQYVIHRLCSKANTGTNDPAQQCLTITETGTNTSRGSASYGQSPLSGQIFVYYRITSRAVGPRNTVSYTQTIMY